MITQQTGGRFCLDGSAISFLRLAGEDYLRAMGFFDADERAIPQKYCCKRNQPAPELPSQGSGDTASVADMQPEFVWDARI
ncbi:hypothetical protein BV898_19784 [Hypsibius exemplaris]|uniref:Uncharacterized protein n=1 Tax=Hypsibius exemplaris TaxID=2072580 RepID=A0A9X6RPE6_HYPEX|nr:hypothetical protein BV898_19784 [Hypsibius exemplaris]